jgi:hypothetical protein
MIYLDSSVALAYLLAEHRYPSHARCGINRSFQAATRINARRLRDSHGEAVRGLIGRIAITEMVPPG